jgi:hypothetical protein
MEKSPHLGILDRVRYGVGGIRRMCSHHQHLQDLLLVSLHILYQGELRDQSLPLEAPGSPIALPIFTMS